MQPGEKSGLTFLDNHPIAAPPPVNGLVEANGILVLASGDSVMLLTPDGELIDSITAPAPVERIGLAGNRVVVEFGDTKYVLNEEMTQLQPSQNLPEAAPDWSSPSSTKRSACSNLSWTNCRSSARKGEDCSISISKWNASHSAARASPNFMCLTHSNSTKVLAPVGVGSKRKKLWTLPNKFHCSVVGTCLTLDELRKIQSKTDMQIDKSASDYELHLAFVGALGDKSPVTRQLQKHLDRKYHAAVRRVRNMRSDDALRAFWRVAIEEGEIAGAYWAIVTHPWVSTDLLAEVYGDVHMFSHLSGASLRADQRRLRLLRQRKRELTTQLAQAEATYRRNLRDKNKTIEYLKKRVTQLEIERSRMEARFQESDTNISAEKSADLDRERQLLMRKLTHLAETSKQTKTALQQLQRRYQVLKQQFSDKESEKVALEHSMAMMLDSECSECAHQDYCKEDSSLRGRCVLFVGGRGRQSSHFRALVERLEGRFLHHDGGLEEKPARLHAGLAKADVVFCPLDSISHDAVQRMKRFCQLNDTPLVYLPCSSLSTFNRALQEHLLQAPEPGASPTRKKNH